MIKPHPPQKGWKELDLERVPDNPHSNGLVVFRVSNRWYTDKRSQKDVLAVPYIDRSGLIYATPVCWWKCTAFQLYATITATVYKRLKSLVYSIPHKRRPRDSNLIFKIAMIYADTNDDSWYKRCIAMLFNNKSSDLLHFVNSKLRMDANKGFLYGQALYNASWLKRRSRFCRKCDKSIINDRPLAFQLYHLWSKDHLSRGSTERSVAIDFAKHWSSVYRVDSAKHSTAAFNSGRKDLKNLLWFRGYPQ